MHHVESEAEALLNEVPGWMWDRTTLPIPVEDLADTLCGMFVRDVEDLALAPGAPALAPGESLSGLLLVDRREIWVDAGEGREWPGRRRFTIGHELGHWVMHRGERQAVFCRSASLSAGEGGVDFERLPAIEEEAHAFAAALLMPAEVLREQFVALGGELEALCRTFGASKAAMMRRIDDVVEI